MAKNAQNESRSTANFTIFIFFFLTLIWEFVSIIIPFLSMKNFYTLEFINKHYFIYSALVFVSVLVYSISISVFVRKSKRFFLDLVGILFVYMLIVVSLIGSYAAMYHIIFNMNLIDSIYSSSKVFATIGVPKNFGKSIYLYYCIRPSNGCLSYLHENNMKVLSTVTAESILSHITSIVYFSFVVLGYQKKQNKLGLTLAVTPKGSFGSVTAHSARGGQ